MADKAKQYNRLKVYVKFGDVAFLFLYLAVFQLVISSFLTRFLLGIAENFYSALTFYLLVFSFLYYLVDFPLSLYAGFLLERRFKLSNQSFFAWFKDDVKKSAISFFIFVLFIHVLYFFLRNFDTTWWAWIAAFYFLATIFIAKITPVIIIPLFFKYSPVEDDLKQSIIELSKKCGIKVLNVYKIDFSKKTNKLNAAVTGLGNTRRVILADNLVEQFTDAEIRGVLAHEFGHHKLHHMWKLLGFGIISIFLSFYVLYLVSSGIIIQFNAEGISDIKIFPVFMLVLFIVSFFLLPIQNGFSRVLERKADIFALNVTQDKDVFVSLMNKLAEKNLSDRNPPKFVKFLFYDHPPISERIKLAENFK